MYPIIINSINSNTEFYEETIRLVVESQQYLKSFKWCEKIEKGWLYVNLGYALCIFLYKINNSQSPEDDLIWIIVGDLPSMYLDTFNVKSTYQVIEGYIDLVKEWVKKTENGLSIKDCFPIDVIPTKAGIEMLKKRISLLERIILPEIEDICIIQISPPSL